MADSSDFFKDLHLTELIMRMKKLSDTDPSAYFYEPAGTVMEAEQRQEVFKDLRKRENFQFFDRFCHKMALVERERKESREKIYKEEKNLCLFHSIRQYVELVDRMSEKITDLPLESERMKRLRDGIRTYREGEIFGALLRKTEDLSGKLEGLQYVVVIDGYTVTVKKEKQDAVNYTELVRDTFKDFLEITDEYPLERPEELKGLNPFQAKILEQTVKLYPELFGELDRFVEENGDYIEEMLFTVTEELGFYMSYIRMTEELSGKMTFSYPELKESREGGDEIRSGTDLLLALQMDEEGKKAVANDFDLGENDYLAVVTGPNQGGKTTFARMVGQIYYLSRLGVMIPAEYARLTLTKKIETHFEREETENRGIGKLEDDIMRLHAMTERADEESLVIANELFSSTAKKDAEKLADETIRIIKEKGARILYVTFLETVSRHKDAVTYVSMVDQNDPDHRLFKIRKCRPDNRAHTRSLIRKYRIGKEDIIRRLER